MSWLSPALSTALEPPCIVAAGDAGGFIRNDTGIPSFHQAGRLLMLCRWLWLGMEGTTRDGLPGPTGRKQLAQAAGRG